MRSRRFSQLNSSGWRFRERMAFGLGMKEKAEEFVAAGGEIYQSPL
jgi:hypothetical protein